MGSALEVNPDIGLRELLRISQSNNWSVQYSPFSHSAGGRQGATIIRRAAPWKGMSMEEIEDQYPEVAAGLREAQSMAEATRGADGHAVIEKGGEAKIVPASAGELAEAGQKDWDVTEGFTSYSDAVDYLINSGHERPVLPSVA